MSRALEVKDLVVTYGKKDRKTYAVQNISFSLDSGETLGVVGESGCGKTTAALALMGLLDPRTSVTGTMILNGEEYDLADMTYKQWKKIRGTDIAMVFQDSLASLNPLKKIGEQIAEAIYVKGGKKSDARVRALELLKMVEMPDAQRRMSQYPHECSGGMRQRAMIAMALANKPAVLICDEPTTALDVTVQAQILEMIKKLQIEMGMAVVLVTHDLGVVNAVSDDIAVMYAGKIVEQGTTDKIITLPEHPYTNALMRAMPDLADSRGALYSIPGVPPALNQIFEWCPFESRCEFVQVDCNVAMPPLVSDDIEDSDHKVACFHPVSISEKTVVP